MVDCRFEVRLKQHTPMIHFQHDQTGATLRATEVKPKLDQYVRKAMGLGPHERLRYQLAIEALGPKDKPGEPPKPYFGNIGQGPKKKTIFHKGGVAFRFNTYFNPSLAKGIKTSLSQCLAMENFGTRQNKGFGCFYPTHEQPDGFKPMDIQGALRKCGKPVFYFDPPAGEDAIACIDVLYKAMKPGINETNNNRLPDRYIKSLLWRYYNDGRAKDDLITWEKRFMKKMLSGESVGGGVYLRALLGTSDGFFFRRVNQARMDSDYGDRGRFSLEANKRFNVRNTTRGGGPSIDRFKSPITFKPVGKRVYIILNPETYSSDNLNVLGAPFNFKCGGLSGTLKVPGQGPDGKPFELEKFMAFVMEQVNNNNLGGPDRNWDAGRALRDIQIHKIEGGGQNA